MKIDDKIKELEDRKKLIISQIEYHTDRGIIKDIVDSLRMINYTLNELKDIDFIQDDSVFSVDDILLKNPTMTGGETMYSIQRKIINRIERIRNEKQASKIITNVKIGSVIQDIGGYTINPANINLMIKEATKPYPIGNINGLDIYVDAHMKFNDDRIIFFKDEHEVYTLTIKDTHNVLI